MKRYSLLFAAFLLYSIVCSQSTEVKVSNPLKEIGLLTPNINGACYGLIITKKNTVVQKFDKDLNLVSEETADPLTYKGNFVYRLGVIQTNKYVYAQTEGWDMKTKEIFTVLHQFDPKTHFSKPGVAISACIHKNATNPNNDLDKTLQSADKKLLAGIAPLTLQEDKGNQKIPINVFNEDLEPKWQKVQEIPYEARETQLRDAILTNNGAVIVIARIITGDKSEAKAFIVTASDLKEINIPLGTEKHFVDAELVADKDGSVVITGLYSTDNTSSITVSGCFVARINVGSGQLSEVKTTTFSKDLLATFTQNQLYNGLPRLLPIGTLLLDNGSICLIAQNHFTATTPPTSSISGSESYSSMGDALLLEFDKDLNTKFLKAFPLSGKSSKINYNALSNNQIVLYHNGAGKQIFSTIYAATISDKGEVITDEVILDDKALSINFLFSQKDIADYKVLCAVPESVYTGYSLHNGKLVKLTLKP